MTQGQIAGVLPRLMRAVGIGTTFFVLLAGTAIASNIEMNNGTSYPGVTIVRRNAQNVEFSTKYGTIVVPTADVARIDGVAVSAPVGTPVRPSVSATAQARTIPSPTAETRSTPLTLSTPPIGAVSAGAKGPLTPVRSPGVVPAGNLHSSTSPSSSTAPASSAWILPLGLDPRDWNLSWSMLGVPVIGLAWLLSVRRVVRDTQHAPGAQRGLWLLVALILPVLGWVVYELVRIVARGQRDAANAADSIHEFIFLDVNHQPVMIEPGAGGSGLENAKGVLQAALFDRASDVHIEPGALEYRVRFRIDGVLNPRMGFSPENGLRMVSALKNVAQLDISDRRKAQDGRFGGRAGGRDVDFRAATTPTVHGEKLVLRVLDQKSGVRGLADLGMTPGMMERFAEVIRLNSGMILATGPTGSGKTSSLYAALTQLDTVSLNIVTIEDPVEYELAGATQIPVNVKAGITYESGLRSILRQDPDVILVGEMRDLEAAQIALRSALTGHLVFSSLHSRDAVGTIHRLEEMGIERHLLASALLVVLSQRLVRLLCPACRRPTVCAGNELAEIGIELPAGHTIYEPGGCRRCESSGYVGRTGLFEMLVLDETLRQEINEGTPEDDFTRLARANGYREYREDGAEKVLLGITSVEEVLKAT